MKSGIFYGWRIVVMAFVIYVISYGMSMVFAVFFKPLLVEFGWNRGMTSTAYSINQVIFGLFALLSGALSDKFGVRKVLFISSIIYGVGLMSLSRTSALWQFYLLYGIMVGAGYGSLTVPSVATVTRWFEKNRGIAVGLTQSGVGGGTLILSPIVAYLIYHYGWRSSYLILGITTIAVLAPVSLLFKDRPSDVGLNAYGEGVASAVDRLQPPNTVNNGLTGRDAIKAKPFWFLNTIHFTDCVCHSIVIVHIVAYLTDMGFSPATAASVFGVMGGASAVGTIISGVLADRVGGRNALGVALVCQACMVFLLLFVRELWLIYLIAIFFGIGYGGLITPYPMLTREYFSEVSAGAIYGGQLASATAGMALGGFMGGYLFDLAGDYRLAFMVSLMAGLLAFSLCMVLRKSGKEAKPAPALQHG